MELSWVDFGGGLVGEQCWVFMPSVGWNYHGVEVAWWWVGWRTVVDLHTQYGLPYTDPGLLIQRGGWEFTRVS